LPLKKKREPIPPLQERNPERIPVDIRLTSSELDLQIDAENGKGES